MPARLDTRNLAAVSRLPKGQVASRLFFFDEQPPDQAFNVHPVYAPVQKVPVTVEGPSAEDRAVATFASSIVALEGGGYRNRAMAWTGRCCACATRSRSTG
jgi:hypothetical protein